MRVFVAYGHLSTPGGPKKDLGLQRKVNTMYMYSVFLTLLLYIPFLHKTLSP